MTEQKQSAHLELEKYISNLEVIVHHLVPNDIPSDIEYIEENIDSIEGELRDFSKLRDGIWQKWKNILFLDLPETTKKGFFWNFRNSLDFHLEKFRRSYNTKSLALAEAGKFLYKTHRLKTLIFSIDSYLKNDRSELDKFISLYSLDIASQGIPLIGKTVIIDLISSGEAPTVEFKSTLKVPLQPSTPASVIEDSAIKTIAAFLNSDGGTLLIGVSDDKKILGLKTDFDSFKKGDKFDEFQKHLDNLIAAKLENAVHRHLKISFEKIEDKDICVISVKKCGHPVVMKDSSKKDFFYIRRLASTASLSLKEIIEYCKEHWPSKIYSDTESNEKRKNPFVSRDTFEIEINNLFENPASQFYFEIKEHWNTYVIIEECKLINELGNTSLKKSLDYQLLFFVSDFVKKHIFYDRDAKYIYNQQHFYLKNTKDNGFIFIPYSHIVFISLLYSTAIQNGIDIDKLSVNKDLNSLYSGIINVMIESLDLQPGAIENPDNTNFHWMIGEIFSFMGNWLDILDEKISATPNSSYISLIPFKIHLCLIEVYKGVRRGKITEKSLVSYYHYTVFSYYFLIGLNESLRASLEENILSKIPFDILGSVLNYCLDAQFSIDLERLNQDDFGYINESEKKILQSLKKCLNNIS